MASSSQPAASRNDANVDEFGLWRRMLKVEEDAEWDRTGVKTRSDEEFERVAESVLEEILQLFVKLKRVWNRASVAQPKTLMNAFKEMFSVTFSGVPEAFTNLMQKLDRVLEEMGDQESSAVLKWLEDRRADSCISSPRIIFLLHKFLARDKKRQWETRLLELFWRHSTRVPDGDILFCLGSFVEHYSPSHEKESLEEFTLTDGELANFLSKCASLDLATRFANKFKEIGQGQKTECRVKRDDILYAIASSEFSKPLAIYLPFSSRFATAKECLHRLDLAKELVSNVIPHRDSLAPVLRSFTAPELRALNALKKEVETQEEVALQMENLRRMDLQGFETLETRHPSKLKEFVHTCEGEKRKVVNEAIYKGLKCLASVKKANIDIRSSLSSKEMWERVVHAVGDLSQEVDGQLREARRSPRGNEECSLCCTEFSSKRKRACLDPCGHAGLCLSCASRAWAIKPNCPWCDVIVQQPIPIPPQIFF